MFGVKITDPTTISLVLNLKDKIKKCKRIESYQISANAKKIQIKGTKKKINKIIVQLNKKGLIKKLTDDEIKKIKKAKQKHKSNEKDNTIEYINYLLHKVLKYDTLFKSNKRKYPKYNKVTIQQKIDTITKYNDDDKVIKLCGSRRIPHTISKDSLKIFLDTSLEQMDRLDFSGPVSVGADAVTANAGPVQNSGSSVLCIKCPYKSNNYVCNKLILIISPVIKKNLTNEEWIHINEKCKRKIVEVYRLKHGANSVAYCQSPSCPKSEYGFILNKDDKTPIEFPNRVKCPDCNETWCKLCNEKPYHYDMLCKDIREIDENDESIKLIKGMAKRCPNKNCGNMITKDQGCHHMQCNNCNTHFCWRCGLLRDPNDPYNHICPPNTPGEADPHDHPGEQWMNGLPQQDAGIMGQWDPDIWIPRDPVAIQPWMPAEWLPHVVNDALRVNHGIFHLVQQNNVDHLVNANEVNQEIAPIDDLPPLELVGESKMEEVD